MQKRVNININHYKAYSETKTSIELDIIPMKGEYGKFININENKKYFHIYFNDNKKKETEKPKIENKAIEMSEIEAKDNIKAEAKENIKIEDKENIKM